jgi:hypothetical protein
METTFSYRITGFIFLSLCATLLTGCASSLQGSVGPLASPKAAQIIDLVDEMYTRAQRLEGRPQLMVNQKNAVNTPNTDIEMVNCLGNDGKHPRQRELELSTETLGFDEKLFESRLWKSSYIPRSASLEIMCLTRAQSALEGALEKQGPLVAQRERNSLQDRLLAASEQSCSNYKRYLNAVKSSTNFGLGASALTLAAVATNVASPLAAKNYTTGALITSGLATQYNADMFSSQLVFVISKAIDAERESALTQLRQARKDKDLDRYSLAAAVSDALRYHDLCSMSAGLAKLDLNTTLAKDPGLRHIASMFPGGELQIKDGRISAKDLQVGGGIVGGYGATARSASTEGLPSVLADVQFESAIQQITSEQKAKVTALESRVKDAKPEKINAIKETPSLKAFLTFDSSGKPKSADLVEGGTCTWDHPMDFRAQTQPTETDKTIGFCKPKTYLDQLCNAYKDSGTKCAGISPTPDAGKPLAEKLASQLRTAAAELDTARQLNNTNWRAKQAIYEIALTAHDSYVRQWLLPAQQAYRNALDKAYQDALDTVGRD